MTGQDRVNLGNRWKMLIGASRSTRMYSSFVFFSLGGGRRVVINRMEWATCDGYFYCTFIPIIDGRISFDKYRFKSILNGAWKQIPQLSSFYTISNYMYPTQWR